MKKNTLLKPIKLNSKLKKIRENLKLFQSEMLQSLGFDEVLFRGNISQYELGRREPRLRVLLAYARIAGVSVDVLIDDDAELFPE
jgi:transcriptional regulator with XRE-family HTH domain